MIDRETYEKMITQMQHTYNHPATRKWAQRKVDELLEIQGEEVEEPPVMPTIRAGKWEPGLCGGDNAWAVWADGDRIAVSECVMHSGGITHKIETEKANAYFWAGSQEVTEKVIDWLESFGVHTSKTVIAIVNAIEKQGCNVDKFR